jgi:predicted RNA binding protein YcfA (HicA-like mRNA interferase family)
MPVGYYKELVTELQRLGFKYERQAKGSHEQWKHPQTLVTITVPKNLYSRHTANGILKKAQSSKKF